MKSIVEEASSITKAIEKAWLRAQKPREFSIKIFEEAEKNFIGMTTKSAKIGLFYKEEQSEKEQRPARQHGQQSSQHIQRRPYNRRPASSAPHENRHENRSEQRQEPRREQPHREPSQPSEQHTQPHDNQRQLGPDEQQRQHRRRRRFRRGRGGRGQGGQQGDGGQHGDGGHSRNDSGSTQE